jgi:hypothetical protein
MPQMHSHIRPPLSLDQQLHRLKKQTTSNLLPFPPVGTTYRISHRSRYLALSSRSQSSFGAMAHSRVSIRDDFGSAGLSMLYNMFEHYYLGAVTMDQNIISDDILTEIVGVSF